MHLGFRSTWICIPVVYVDTFLTLTYTAPMEVKSQCPAWSPFISHITFLLHALVF